jgi:hypothetical protein
MQRVRAGWWTLILMLVVLLAPVHAHADYWWVSGGGATGPVDPSGDPDSPIGPGLSPGQRAGSVRGGDTGYVKPRTVHVDRMWMGRYLTMLSGLRSFYLRF